MAVNIKSGDLLTLEQLNNHLAIYAGPGSGKTHFLVNNTKNIIATHPKITGSNERKILCITYTNAAVEEIQRRLDNYSTSVFVDTIHEFIIQNIILPFQSDLKKVIKKDFGVDIVRNTKITSQIEGLSILHGVDKETINMHLQNLLSVAPLDYSKKILSEVEVDNKAFLDDGSHIFKHSSKIKKEHAIHIKKYIWETVGKLTHDEILYFGYRMIQENSTITYSLRVKYPFIFVDEFQDTNPLQTLIIKLLGEKSTIVGVIGDVAQSIYSFQGAQPSQFKSFTVNGIRETTVYNISGNRRSTNNIVQLCNYLRSSDTLEQTSIKPYKNEDEKISSENISVHFLCGYTEPIMSRINDLVDTGAVVLTRTWASAFSYIRGIDEEQRTLLNAIYNRYYPTSIDIRSDIVEHNRVVWVRAFRFIITLYLASQTGSFVDVLNAISLYKKISELKKNSSFTPQIIFGVKSLLDTAFKDVSDNILICDIIDNFNSLISEKEDIKEQLFSDNNFSIEYLSDFDDDIAVNLKKIKWDTAMKLFRDVFAKDAKYMTVHQAKGLEWDTVVVGALPGARDRTSLLQVFSSPSITGESVMDEFVRIYYVACSRAKKTLYIHIPDDQKLINAIKENLELFKRQKECSLTYDFL